MYILFLLLPATVLDIHQHTHKGTHNHNVCVCVCVRVSCVLLLPAAVLDIHQVMVQGLLHVSKVIYFVFVLFEQFLKFSFPFSSRQEAFLYHMDV